MDGRSRPGGRHPRGSRFAGQGPLVLCLHANGSSGAQWRPLAGALGPRWRVAIPFELGRGRTPVTAAPQPPTLGDDVRQLDPMLASAVDGVHLVGHGYGGAVALRAALERPGNVRSVTVFEPLLFSLPLAGGRHAPAMEAVDAAVRDAQAALARGEPDAAARRVLDFWAGPGSFDALPARRRARLGSAMHDLDRWWQALATDPTPLVSFAGLDVPVLYLMGRRTAPAAAAVADALLPVLPLVQCIRFDGMGHLGPVEQPGRVNAVIRGFLEVQRAATRAGSGVRARASGAADPSDAALIASWGVRAEMGDARPRAGRPSRAEGAASPGAPLPLPSSDPQAAQQQPFRAPPV